MAVLMTGIAETEGGCGTNAVQDSQYDKPHHDPGPSWPESNPELTHDRIVIPVPDRGPTRKTSSKSQISAWKFPSDSKEYGARPRRSKTIALSSTPANADLVLDNPSQTFLNRVDMDGVWWPGESRASASRVAILCPVRHEVCKEGKVREQQGRRQVKLMVEAEDECTPWE
jgi:hypothetical protein